jgi:hypothetical protein
VDPAGRDDNDCLASGNAACATIQHAADLACFGVDAGNSNVGVQIDNGTYQGGAQITTSCLAQNTVDFTGNASAPADVVVQRGTSGPIFFAKDKGFISLNGMVLQPTVSEVEPISCGQHANFDVSNVIIYSTPGGDPYFAVDNCTINILSGNSFYDNVGAGNGGSSAAALFYASNTARIAIDAPIAMRGMWRFSYGCVAESSGVIQFAANATISGGTVSGQKYLVELNGVILGGANNCPGSTAGQTISGGQVQ